MLVIGITGSVGTGKTTVARMFAELGAKVLDADALIHEALEPNQRAWRQLVKRFGPAILNADQTINRSRLAAIIFNDEQQRRDIEALLHPYVRRRMGEAIRRLRRSGRVRAVVLDVPLLIETGTHRSVDLVVVVTAPARVQRRRLRSKFGWSDREIQARSRAQWDVSAKVALADAVIDNANGVEATRTQVERLWNSLERPKRLRRRRSLTSRH